MQSHGPTHSSAVTFSNEIGNVLTIILVCDNWEQVKKLILISMESDVKCSVGLGFLFNLLWMITVLVPLDKYRQIVHY